MPINTPTGYLDITNATLRGSKIVTTGFVGIANANPTNHLSIGSNLHINDTHSNVLQISGNINASRVVLGGITIAPTFDLEVITNTGNTTPNTLEFNNTAMAFVTTANATIGDTLTASKLVGDGSGISAIQSSNVSDFGSNVTRITNLESSRALKADLNNNSSRITNLSSNLSDNSSRITTLESGDISISGEKTFTGQVIFESNIHMAGGNVLIANTINMTVSDPIIELGSNNHNTGDLGIIMTRHNNNSNVAVVFDESVDILKMGYTLNGANDTVVELDSNALAVSVQGTMTADKIVASNVISSTSKTTGALTVAGGVGVGGNVYIGSNLSVTGDVIGDLSVTGDATVSNLSVIADAPEIRIQDNTGSSSETTMSIVADGGTTHFRAGIDTFAEGTETKGNVKFQSSTGATTHAEIVGSSGTLELQDGGLGLKLGSNVSVTGTSKVIQEITGPHARDSAVLKKYPEVDMTSSVKSGYVIEASSEHSSGTYPGWNAFNGVVETTNGADGEWISGSGKYNTSATNGAYLAHSSNAVLFQGARGEYLGIVLPRRIKVKYVSVYGRPDSGSPRTVREYILWGSNDGSTWNQLQTGTNTLAVYASTNKFNITVDATTAYSRYRLQALSMNTPGNGVSIGELEYYGYEDVGAGDDSVDTTVKSVYNAPDLTSAALYIDGKKSGSTPTDYGGSSITVTNNGTWDSSDNTWSLSGATTSNLVSADLGFVGDQPHSISAWVKADRLNGSGLFHLGTAEGEGDAASRVGFVDDSHISWGGEDHFFSNAEWHNVTYAYNGEGSDKKLYLDGRLVGTAKNEDSHGEFPSFAMSGHSQYGYTVSASSEYPGTDYLAHEAFNKTRVDNADAWLSGNAQNYNGGSGAYSGSANLGSDSGGAAFANADKGEWLKMEMPHKLVLDYIDICGSTSTNVNPKDWKIWGSNDGKNWDVLLSKTNTVTAAYNASAGRTHTVSATRAYKFFALVVTRTNGYTYYTQVCELQLFGHRENDLVRFPDSVNVRTYPHMAMAAPVHRGYVASASSYRAHADHDYRPYKAFNKVFNTSGYHGWNNQNTLTEYNGTDYLYNGSINLGTGAQNGEWIKLELPRKILMTSMTLYSRDNDPTRAPEDFIVYGSNDDSNWSELLSEVGATPPDTGATYTADTATTHYKYFALVVRRIAGQNNYFSIDNIEYIGTEETSDVVARVGEFDGKIRNLRVYSTALSDARVQEIFDADKDELGLAKSSVSVYRGHLGVGTTEPKAALTVMDEVAELDEFPPKPMMAAETYMEGHGNFKVCASSYYGTDTSLYQPYAGFKRSADPTTNWPINTWNSIGPSYSTTTKQVTSGASLGGYAGEWLKLSLPYGVKLSGYQLMIKSGWAKYGPGDWVIVGSNDDTTWHLIASVTAGGTGMGDDPVDTSTTDPRTKDFVVETTKYYKHLALVCSAVHGTGVGQVNFTGLRYFGTREQGASTLHNGELSLTRNLTVPRIGPPLDADDTPRRDRLVVEYNTSTNPTENGVVKDTSGRGLDGLTYNGASYDDTEKALVFDGSNDYVFQNDVHLKTGVGGVYSASVWVRNRASTGLQTVYSIGTYAQLTTSTLYVQDASLHVVFYASDLDVTYTIPKSTWTNIVVTHGGGATSTTTKMYINGVDVGLAETSGTNYPLSTVNFPSPCNLFLGKNSDNTVYGGPMDLSNFKLWDAELSADDAKRLYDMGRCGEGHHVVNFSKTRVGIGLGDGEAPRGALDVRGSIHANGGQSWPVPTAVFSNVTPSNTGSSWYSRNIGTQYVHYNTINKSDSSGTIGSPTLNTDNITLYRTGMYEIYTESCLQLQGSTAAHIGTRIQNKNLGGSLIYLDANGQRSFQSDYRTKETATRTHAILVTEAPVVIAYYLQPTANRTDRFMEMGYGSSARIHTVYVKYLG